LLDVVDVIRPCVHHPGVIVVGYKPWLRWSMGLLLVTLMFVVIAEQGVRKLDIDFNNVPRVTLPSADLQVSPLSLVDARIPRPARGPTGPTPPHPMQVAAGSAAVLPEVQGEDLSWSAMLRPPGSDDS
jgi:hypothetical protein